MQADPPRYYRALILGAGTSAEAGVPVTKNFRATARRVAGSADGKVRDRMLAVIDHWDRSFSFYNIEELYSYVELCEGAGISLPGDPSISTDDIRFLILATLGNALARVDDRMRNRYSGFWSRTASDSLVLSFNWDNLLDIGVTGATGLGETLDYGPIPIIPCGFGSDGSSPTTGHRTLVKPHGSTNWLHCKRCGNVHVYPSHLIPLQVSIGGSKVNCTVCGDGSPLQPLIVPPSPQKVTGDPSRQPFAALWRLVAETLTQVHEVHLIGYSMPEMDLQFKLLFRETLSRNTDLEKVMVHTTSKVGYAWTDFQEHFVEILSPVGKAGLLSFREEPFGRYAGP